jgi:hypothetical protein
MQTSARHAQQASQPTLSRASLLQTASVCCLAGSSPTLPTLPPTLLSATMVSTATRHTINMLHLWLLLSSATVWQPMHFLSCAVASTASKGCKTHIMLCACCAVFFGHVHQQHMCSKHCLILCVICAPAGSYSPVDRFIVANSAKGACTACPNGKTTRDVGSPSDTYCEGECSTLK